MPIGDIAAEKAQQGELDPQLARDLGATGRRAVAQGQRMNQAQMPAQARRQAASMGMQNVVQLEKTDIQFWLDVGIFVLLILIFLKV